MKNRDRELSDRAIAAVAEMSSRLEEKEFIDPGGFSSLSNGYAQLDSDIRRKMGKLTSALGLINKELKKNLNAFREIYDDYPGLLRKHNEELLRSEYPYKVRFRKERQRLCR